MFKNEQILKRTINKLKFKLILNQTSKNPQLINEMLQNVTSLKTLKLKGNRN